MALVDFVATVILVTASGALAPGPLFFGTILHGTKFGARAGLLSSIGHTLVEFPLVLFLALGLVGFTDQPMVRTAIGVAGGTALLGFGALQIRSALSRRNPVAESNERGLPKSSLVLGIMLTALNPYFIFWWLTVGSKLVVDALIFASLAGVLLMYLAHVWMDYAYLITFAHIGRKGADLIGTRRYRFILGVFGAVLVYFGLFFIQSVLL